MTLDLATGYRKHRYDNDTIFNSFDDWIIQGNVDYKISRKLSAALAAKRDRVESVYQNVGYFKSNSVGLTLSHKITSRIKVDLNGAFEHNAYPRETTEGGGALTKKRKDIIMLGGAKVNWKPRRFLNLSVGYGFRQRDSNFDNIFDYVDHTLDTSASCKF